MTGFSEERLSFLDLYEKGVTTAFEEIRSLNDEFVLESGQIEYLREKIDKYKALYHSGELGQSNIVWSAYIATIDDFLNLSVPTPGEPSWNIDPALEDF